MTSHEARVARALSRINSAHGHNLPRLGDFMDDYTLYDVLTTCRDCKVEYMGKAFKPADDRQRWGQCGACAAVESAPKLPHPPKDTDLHPPRRTWEPN